MAEPVEPPTILSESSSSAMQGFNSIKVSLADLCAKGTAQYAHKNYLDAANFYAMASEMQAELNGEMSPDNAEILFLYGRTLFKVGVSKSDVLGGKASGEKKKSNKSNGAGGSKEKKELPAVTEETSEEKIESEKIAEEGVAIVAEQKDGEQKEEEKALEAKKPLFQFTGDENFEDSDDEEEVEEAEGAEEEEEEDELASAFMVLDLARVLFTKKLEEPEAGNEKGKAVGDSPMVRHIKERLADAHEILAEISLENEKFPEAVKDSRSALAYKIELYPEESELIAEAHFKLSLALEFASITTTEDAPSETESHLDQSLRDEAVRELELAIKSCKLKLQNAEVQLASTASPDDNDLTRAAITDIKEMIADLEARLVELRGPPVDIKKALYGSDAMNGAAANSGGILAAALGESPTEAAARLEEAKKNAHDITSVVRKKEKVKPAEAKPAGDGIPSHNGTNGKRKAEAEADAEGSGSKKAKVDEELVKKSVEEPVKEIEEAMREKLEGVEVKDFAEV